MKRIKAACICQTLHFQLKEDLEHSIAVRLVREEVEHYKQALERNRTRHKIVDEAEQEDGSVVIRIIKQYNRRRVGDYLDSKEPVCRADRLFLFILCRKNPQSIALRLFLYNSAGMADVASGAPKPAANREVAGSTALQKAIR